MIEGLSDLIMRGCYQRQPQPSSGPVNRGQLLFQHVGHRAGQVGGWEHRTLACGTLVSGWSRVQRQPRCQVVETWPVKHICGMGKKNNSLWIIIFIVLLNSVKPLEGDLNSWKLIQRNLSFSYHNRPVWQCLEQSVGCCTGCSWGCNRCPAAIADMTALYTEGEEEMQFLMKCFWFWAESRDPGSPTDLVVVGDEAVLAHVHTVLEAE